MVKEKKTDKSDTNSRKKTVFDKQREDLLECIGGICFTPDGKIKVKVDKDKNPECAKRVADYVLAGNEVVFEVTRTVGVDIKE